MAIIYNQPLPDDHPLKHGAIIIPMRHVPKELEEKYKREQAEKAKEAEEKKSKETDAKKTKEE